MYFLEKRPCTETAYTKTDRGFQAILGYGKNWFRALKQHWEMKGMKLFKREKI